LVSLNSEKIERGTLHSKSPDVRRSGLFFTFTGSAFLLLITFLETIYPGYSVHTNTISDLFAVGRLTSTIGEPIAFLIAVTWITGGYYLYRRTEKRWRLVLNVLPGTGLLLAVLSPENVNVGIHSIGAVLAFFSAPIIMLLAFKSITTAFRYFSLFFGIFSLAAAILEFGAYYSSVVQQSLGPGGAERMIIYPVIIWLIGYGNYLLAKEDTN
jgi:hypothetical membrane protein